MIINYCPNCGGKLDATSKSHVNPNALRCFVCLTFWVIEKEDSTPRYRVMLIGWTLESDEDWKEKNAA